MSADAGQDPYDNPVAFGQRVQIYRNRRGMTREQLAGLPGRHPSWVKKVETGTIKVPRLPEILRIAEILRVRRLNDLVGEVGAEPHTHPYGDPACRPTSRGRWEQRLATDAAPVLATVNPPGEAVAAEWVAHLTDRGDLLAHGVRCFHFQERGRRTASADEALANWDAVVGLAPAAPASGHWGKAVSLAQVIRDLQREEDEHQARRRARTG
ncbi:helix-turn-helix transcriptional regulator [Streptomyces sp. G-G2]|uniref:helix-turn-helix domain-containing protein n=1 Tax=Streptomyces sp. G-G2 TaxID=3046201 RepID=UPI0024B8EE6B|nr:helix-turn-helix transcriptional regulator [Streptomyces sp. G-G2]MDJ0384766.1 helix-turn-helix transcriptional regulator [Streptomyces sp. G-G2]